MNILEFLKKSIAGEISVAEQEDFLRSKSDVTAEELAYAVKFLLGEMSQKITLKGAIDVCGTGGSGLTRINTSTIAAFVLASMGIKIAKHGNKAASGRFGSFDLLEEIGVDLEKSPTQIEREFGESGLAFLYARNFHPVMRHFAEVRTKIGKPTFFNLLGPLLSPTNVKRQIIGTAFKDKMQLIAETCKMLGKEKVYVVCGEDGLDEVTLTGETYVTELNNGKIRSYTIRPEDFGVKRCKFKDIEGGDAEFNTNLTREIIEGECDSRHLDLVLVNCALALKLCDYKGGYEAAYDAVKNGVTLRHYLHHVSPNILTEIVASKKPTGITKRGLKPSSRDFHRAIKTGGPSVIAEIKRKSPSKGLICKGKFSPVKIALDYEKNGASAISVLCDEKYFGGSFDYMREASESTDFTPILCKDFIIDESQIYKARKYGADAVLLIAGILTTHQMNRFINVASSLNMDVLCEVHDSHELKKALKTLAKIIGINNRDLKSFQVDLDTTRELMKHIPKDRLVVSESGISSKKDVPDVDGVLVGTSLMGGKKITDLVRPKLKVCGVRSVKEAKFCEDAGVDFIGLNFVPTSKRCISFEKGKNICKKVHNVYKVGVFQNQTLSEIKKISKYLDFIQLSGDEDLDFMKKLDKPVISSRFPEYCAYILFDGPVPGSGKTFDLKKIRHYKGPYFIAGGINTKNIDTFIKLNPLGIDIASGIETNGKIDLKKITFILNKLKKC